jgi:DNA transformation protein and related proteins
MKRDDSFKDFVIDQLRDLEPLTCRAMFGSYGLYHHGSFFGIISGGRLYFKTTDTTRPEYLRRGMQPFQPNERQTLKSYYEVPADVMEDDELLAAWAREAAAGES